MSSLAFGQADDHASQRDFLMGQAVEFAKDVGGGAQPQEAVDFVDFTVRLRDPLEQAAQRVAVDGDGAPRDRRVGEHTDRGGMLQGFEIGLVESHRLDALELPVTQVVQRLGDDGMVERIGFRHGAASRFRQVACGFSFNVPQATGKTRQAKEF
jgi:hypothetical protein